MSSVITWYCDCVVSPRGQPAKHIFNKSPSCGKCLATPPVFFNVPRFWMKSNKPNPKSIMKWEKPRPVDRGFMLNFDIPSYIYVGPSSLTTIAIKAINDMIKSQ